MHVVGLIVPENMTISGLLVGKVRCGAPTLLGARGTTERGEPVTLVSFEWPQRFRDPPGGASKSTAEARHLARFRKDLRFGGQPDPYDGEPTAGQDPPDFVCATSGRSIGVELTQLVIEDRVAADNMFNRVRRAVLGTDRNRFRALAGHVVYVNFVSGLPFKRTQEVQQLVEGLASFTPVPPPSDGKPPEQLPEGTTRDVLGSKITAAPLSGDPGTAFFRRMGWELALGNTTMIKEATAWAQLEQRVADHDQPGVDDLIVAAGAPLVSGWAYPSDELVAASLIQAAATRVVSTSHISRVFLHTWSGRAVAEITPGTVGVKHLCGDLPVV